MPSCRAIALQLTPGRFAAFDGVHAITATSTASWPSIVRVPPVWKPRSQRRAARAMMFAAALRRSVGSACCSVGSAWNAATAAAISRWLLPQAAHSDDTADLAHLVTRLAAWFPQEASTALRLGASASDSDALSLVTSEEWNELSESAPAASPHPPDPSNMWVAPAAVVAVAAATAAATVVVAWRDLRRAWDDGVAPDPLAGCASGHRPHSAGLSQV
jgi:hypothetical protein